MKIRHFKNDKYEFDLIETETFFQIEYKDGLPEKIKQMSEDEYLFYAKLWEKEEIKKAA